ncbi:MAG: hypothetical protein ACI9YT_000272 [Halobacteriales archaeon]|jgi:hypothetical protein
MIIDSYIPLGPVTTHAMSTYVDPGAVGPETSELETSRDEPFGLKHPTVVPTNFEPDAEDR